MRNNVKIGIGALAVLATPFAIGEVSGNEAQAEYRGQVFYHLNKPANWWHSDGQDWYFFKDGKKYTGWGKDNAGEHYYVNGKYANGRYNGKNYVNGKEESVKEGYSNNLFYSNNRLANWWHDDGSDWYFFKDGKKYTGWGKDNAGEHYYVNGKYANGQYNGKNYVNGKEESVKDGYSNNLFYSNNRLANWWHDDGSDWYFFKDGRKYTGWGKDNAGEHYYVNGKYANGQYNGKNYVNGKEESIKDGYSNNLFYRNNKLANSWHDDGSDWYFFKDGRKYTGWGIDADGEHYYVNGRYANGRYNGKNYVNGKEESVKNGYVNNLFYSNNQLANSWHDDGSDWYFFKDGRKYTGWGIDGNGERYFVNGKYANGQYNGKNYVDGKEKQYVGSLENVLNIARNYLGVQSGSEEHKKIVDAYNSVNPKPVGYTAKYSDDWCDIFVTTVFQQAGLSHLIGRECGVQRHIGILEQKGIWKGKTQPKVGDIVTFDWDGGGWADHIGIVESVNNGVITTIEGNSAQYAGDTAPTKVNRKTYNWDSRYIKGYARPMY